MTKRKDCKVTTRTICDRKDPNFYSCKVKIYCNDKLAGVAEVDIDKYQDEINQGVIWSLEMKEKFRGRGFSRKLIRESIKVAKRRRLKVDAFSRT